MQNIGSLGLETPGLLECSDFSILHVTSSYLGMVSIWLGFQKTALIIQLIPKMAATQKKKKACVAGKQGHKGQFVWNTL